MSQADDIRVARANLTIALINARLPGNPAIEVSRAIEVLIDAKLKALARSAPAPYLDPLTGALGPDTPSTLGG